MSPAFVYIIRLKPLDITHVTSFCLYNKAKTFRYYTCQNYPYIIYFEIGLGLGGMGEGDSKINNRVKLTITVNLQTTDFTYLPLRKFVNNLRQVGGFLRVLRFPPPIKMTITI
jgi:hypothetical protein